jgi:hypothetical protein
MNYLSLGDYKKMVMKKILWDGVDSILLRKGTGEQGTEPPFSTKCEKFLD